MLPRRGAHANIGGRRVLRLTGWVGAWVEERRKTCRASMYCMGRWRAVECEDKAGESMWYYTPSRSLVTTTDSGEREGQWELVGGAIGQLYRNNWTLKGMSVKVWRLGKRATPRLCINGNTFASQMGHLSHTVDVSASTYCCGGGLDAEAQPEPGI